MATTIRSDRTTLALTILRVVIGVVFLVHGYQKLFGFGIPGVTGMFTKFGIPMPGVTAPLVTLVEFFGGLALIAGLLTRLAAFGLAIDMLGAITFVHGKNGFSLPMGYEFVLVLCTACVAIALVAPGPYSLDGLIAARRRTP